jgi:hypothetical protein
MDAGPTPYYVLVLEPTTGLVGRRSGPNAIYGVWRP